MAPAAAGSSSNWSISPVLGIWSHTTRAARQTRDNRRRSASMVSIATRPDLGCRGTTLLHDSQKLLAHRRRVAGMVKLVYCVRRREDVPEDEFHRYWLDEHGPLVRSVADAIGAVRYVQSHTVSPELNAFLRQSRGSAEPYEGITEVSWESLEALQAGMGAPESLEAQQRLIEDESKFIDFARSCVFMTEEHVIFGD
jgi:uncharacterized protein (TIGR02118 family)